MNVMTVVIFWLFVLISCNKLGASYIKVPVVFYIYVLELFLFANNPLVLNSCLILSATFKKMG
jgi:hypothetical protein